MVDNNKIVLTPGPVVAALGEKKEGEPVANEVEYGLSSVATAAKQDELCDVDWHQRHLEHVWHRVGR